MLNIRAKATTKTNAINETQQGTRERAGQDCRAVKCKNLGTNEPRCNRTEREKEKEAGQKKTRARTRIAWRTAAFKPSKW